MINAAGKVNNPKGMERQRNTGFGLWCASYFFSGKEELEVGNYRQLISQNTLLLIPAGQAYRFKVTVSTREIWCLFAPRPELLNYLPSSAFARGIYTSGEHQTAELYAPIANAMIEMLRWWTAGEPHAMLAENALERALLLASHFPNFKRHKELDARIVHLTSIMTRDLASHHTVPLLARTVGMSVSNLAHLFKQQVGCTPMQFLTEKRIAAAKLLLQQTKLRIHEIAEATGFPNEFHFSRRFTSQTGTSPKTFRSMPNLEWGGLKSSDD